MDLEKRAFYRLKDNSSFDKDSVLKLISVLGGVGASGLLLYSFSFLFSWQDTIDAFTNSFLLAIAFMLGGGLLGLLFGIPKSQSDKDLNNGISENTNLEEVSDWLTKIIIGFGIAEISSINDSIVGASSYIKNLLPNISETVIISIIIFFPIYGFISGWLLTRVHLTELFATLREEISENINAIDRILKKVQDNAEFDTDEDILPSLDSSDDINELVSNVRFLEQNNIQLDWETYNKLGLVLTTKRNYGLAGQFFKKAYDLSHDPKPKVNYGVTYSRGFGRPEEAVKIYKEVIEEFKGHDIVARAYYNLACAHARLNQKEEAINALEKSLELKNEYLNYAQEDSAFQVLEAEEKFRQVVPNYKPKTDHHYG